METPLCSKDTPGEGERKRAGITDREEPQALHSTGGRVCLTSGPWQEPCAQLKSVSAFQGHFSGTPAKALNCSPGHRLLPEHRESALLSQDLNPCARQHQSNIFVVLQPQESWADKSQGCCHCPHSFLMWGQPPSYQTCHIRDTWDTVSETKVQCIFRIKMYRENSTARGVDPAVEEPNSHQSHLVPILYPGMGSTPVTDWG